MGIFYRLLRREKRSDLLSDPNHWLAMIGQYFNQSAAGVTVTPQTALATSAVFACVRVIAETIASLPLHIYMRQSDDGKKLALNHPLYPVLHDSPNPWQTSFEFFEMQAAHCCLRGNAYNYIVRDGGNLIKGFVPLNPDRIQIDIGGDFDEPQILYIYQPDPKNRRNETMKFDQDEIWHLRGMSGDGIMGYSVLEKARETIGLTMAAEKHGSKYFANGARPSGVASTPRRLNENARKNLRESIGAAISGDNVFKVLLLEEDLKWQQIGINNVDSQFLETRKFQVEEIARIFRVPTNLIGHTDKTATFASAEHFDIAFVKHCIRPWVARIEKSINKNLFGEKQGRKYFAEFKLDGLLRADTKSRYEAYASALQNEWMTRNEVRALENLNPVPDGDQFKNPAINPKIEQSPNATSKTE